MAKKGQTFKKHSKETKEEILRKYFKENQSARSLGEEYGISKKTIENWVSKIKEGKDVITDHRQFSSGRPKKNYENVDYKEKYEILKKYQAFLKAQREKS